MTEEERQALMERISEGVQDFTIVKWRDRGIN